MSESTDVIVPRSHILGEAYAITNGKRREDYGPPTEQHNVTAEMWTAYSDTVVLRRGSEGFSSVDVCVFNILQKIARHACGGGTRDTWVDIAGYAANAAECEGSDG